MCRLISQGNKPKQQGIALIAVLWVVVMLSVIAGSFSLSMRTELQVSNNEVHQAKATGILRAALSRLKYELSKPPQSQSWTKDGSPIIWPFAGAAVIISLQDARGLVDLNQADKALLLKLFAAIQVEEEDGRKLADTIIDYRDNNKFSQLNGAEDSDYDSAGLPYRSKDALFEAEEEVRLVLGMSHEVYKKLLPFVTVHSDEKNIVPELAPEVLLKKLSGLDPARVDEILQQRIDRATGEAQATDASQQNGQAYHARFQVQFANKQTYTAEAVLEQGGFGVVPYHVVAWKPGVVLTDLLDANRPEPE
ncbi:MAG: hypothetical protein HOM11_11140 [Methylococcales bacterium]|jgi:general secretion pathway protein K|nr:hypothetical protein [Methylococcales bacterium]MBT7443865.1 hypothetical protein [Methylococcales bacterium]